MRAPARPPRIQLDTPVTYLKGVGPARAAALARLGITTAGDLLYHIPHRYEDASTISPISSLEAGMDGTVIGRVISKGVLPTRKGLRVFQAVLKDDTGMIEVSWPGQPFLDRTIDKDDMLLVSGSVRFFHGRQLQPREYINLGNEETGTAQGKVLSVYPATDGLSFKVIRGIIEAHLDALLPLVSEYLPAEVLKRAGVPSIEDAIRLVHRPASLSDAISGRARLAFEELFFVQLLQQRAKQIAREVRTGIHFMNRRELTTRLRESLPFTLTGAQSRVLREIFADMCSENRMQRLLQGDVGSGKTIVALFAAMLALENGYQAAIMAPTELLAEQHFRTLTTLMTPLKNTPDAAAHSSDVIPGRNDGYAPPLLEPILLTGSLKTKARREIASRLAESTPAIIVGTHALVQESTEFARLGLVVVDEQHRFGVEQRKALAAKGNAPDVLLMTATPIPRSLALTLYGDLDLSILDERPPGRQPITTALRPENARSRVLEFVNREIGKGRQVYIVYPVIDESETLDLKAATTMFEVLSTGALAGKRVALLHGRLAASEKDAVMRQFRDGALDALVATTVIEVGIDVPNATVMLVEHPERFGLSQLHQLRGRVGRGGEQSFCILLGDVSPETRQRLDVFVGTEDGFEIARADMELRGMGDLFGQRQSGLPAFRVADPLRDQELNERAHAEAARILTVDPELAHPVNAPLKRILSHRYAKSLELFRVG